MSFRGIGFGLGLAALAAVLAPVGAAPEGGPAPAPPGQGTPAPPPGEATTPAAADVGDGIKAVLGPALKQAILAQKGRVLVLNLWATWCPPCVRELPALSRVYAENRGKGLAVIAASMDDPEDRHKVGALLGLNQIALPVYMRESGSVDAFFDPVDKKWSGALPMTYIFDRSGKRVGKPIDRDMTYGEWTALVRRLLAPHKTKGKVNAAKTGSGPGGRVRAGGRGVVSPR